MLKYLIPILAVLCGVLFYLNLSDRSDIPSSIKIGEVFYIKVVGREDLSAFFKRISATQVLFSFVRDGEQPQVDSNKESVFSVGGEISVLGGSCKIMFDNIQHSYKGSIACNGLQEYKFRAFLQASNVGEPTLQVAEEMRVKTGEVLAKIEVLSDHILSKTLEISDSEAMIGMFKEGLPPIYKDASTKPQSNLKQEVRRSSFLSASKEGQEISLASRLLNEEAKVLLKLEKYSSISEALDDSNSSAVNLSPAEAPTVPQENNANQKVGGEWWKDLD